MNLLSAFKIRAGALIDGSGGHVREQVVIWVKNGIIDAIDPVNKKEETPDITFDFSHCTLLPGLIDSHVHLFMSGTDDLQIRKQQIEAASYSDTETVIAGHIDRLFTCGVAGVRDGGDRFGHALRYKKIHAGSGRLPIQLKVAGNAFHQPGRYGNLIGDPISVKLSEAVRNVPAGVDHIKLVNSGLNSLVEYGRQTLPQFTASDIRAAVSAARDKGLKVMVHANGDEPVRMVIDAGVDSIEHGFFMGRDNLKKMADQQIFWVPTAITMKAYGRFIQDPGKADIAKKNLDHQMEQIALARRLGVPVALGTDAGSLGVYHGHSVAEELNIFCQAGYSVEEAVKCATANGALLMGIESMGSLIPGKKATFIAVTGSPEHLAASLNRPEAFFIDGQCRFNRVSNH